METAREILQFLHYHPLSSREEIRVGIGFQESDATLKRLIATGVAAGTLLSFTERTPRDDRENSER